MKIYDFTQPELDVFRAKCNFTDDELQCFELKAKNKSVVYIAQAMNVSENQVCKLHKRVLAKIIRVI